MWNNDGRPVGVTVQDRPGIFRPLRHYVAADAPSLTLDGDYARRMGLVGLVTRLAICGSPCWLPDDDRAPALPLCPTCTRAGPQPG